MYRDYVLSTRPYAYFPLSGLTGNADLMLKGSTLSNYTSSIAITTNFKQALVPGYQAGSLASSVTTLPARFGVQGDENKTFAFDIWVDVAGALDPTASNRKVWSQSTNFLSFDSKSIIVEFGAVDTTKTVRLSHVPLDPHTRFHVAVTWTGDSAALFINGEIVDRQLVPKGFSFANTSTDHTFTAARASHLAIYERPLNEQDVADKFEYGSMATSHAQACAIDGGTVFEMWTHKAHFIDFIYDDELAGETSIGVNKNKDGIWATREVPNLFLTTGTLSQDSTKTNLGSGQALTVPASGLLGADWVIYIETADSGSRGGDEYLLSLANTNQRLDFFIDSSNLFNVDYYQYNGDGTTTNNWYTSDSAVSTSNAKIAIIMQSGQVSVKTGASTTLNTFASATSVFAPFTVDGATNIIVGRSGSLAGGAVQGLRNLYTHSTILPDTVTSGSYDNYANAYYATGYWPLNSSAGLRGQSKQKLIKDINVYKEGAQFGPWLFSRKSYNADVSFFGPSGSFTTKETHAYIPTSVIPWLASPGLTTDDNMRIEVDYSSELQSGRTYQGPAAVESVGLRMYNTRRVDAMDGQAYIDFSSGTGGFIWIPDQRSQTFEQSPFSGCYWGNAMVYGTVIDPAVDGVTEQYDYRSFELLLYINSAAANTGRVLSIWNGSTEYYLALNAGAMNHNFSKIRINGENTDLVSNDRDQWIHIYVELPSNITDRPLYIGAQNTGGPTWSNGMQGAAIKNLALYDYALPDEKIDEHFQCFVGRYATSVTFDDTNEITLAENAVPKMYSLAWQTTSVPV